MAAQVAALAHLVMWFTYRILDQNRAAVETENATYQEETHQLIATMVSAQIRLAALDLERYERVTPYVSSIINLSEEVDAALTELRTSDSAGRTALLRCNQKALEFVKRFPREIGGIVGHEADAGERHADLLSGTRSGDSKTAA